MIDKLHIKEFKGNFRFDHQHLEASDLINRLPTEYIEFLQSFNGGEGFVGEEYLVLHKAEDLVKVNKDTEVELFDPNIFIIGGNGGGEFVAINFKENKEVYILIPFIFEHEAIIELATDIQGLFKRIFESGYFDS